MKTTFKNVISWSFIWVSIVLVSACQKENMNDNHRIYTSILNVSDDGTSTILNTIVPSVLTDSSPATISEINSLLKFKEEEQLARDVYTALYNKWGNQIFNKIAGAENNHLNAIISLLKYFGSDDTILNKPGKFSNIEIQELYKIFINKGLESNINALHTGATIEELDIKDLTEAIDSLSNENIKIMYENLRRGSRNHLRAFNLQLTSLGETYIPQYLSNVEFNQIITSGMEKGKQYRMQGNNNTNCNNGNKNTGQKKRKGRG